MTTPTPSEAPLSAGAVPELPVVAWRCTQSVPDNGKRLDCVSSNPAYVAMHSTYNWHGLTPHAPAQATIHAQVAEIERLKRGLGAEETRANGFECALKLAYAELESLKAKQVAEADEVMRLAENMMRASWAIGNEGPEYNATREALRAALTKDRA